MNRFQLYKDYKESEIDEVVSQYQMSKYDEGIGEIGYDFVTIQDRKTMNLASFVLIGKEDTIRWIYTCIYTDFNTSNPIKALEIELEQTRVKLTDALNKHN